MKILWLIILKSPRKFWDPVFLDDLQKSSVGPKMTINGQYLDAACSHPIYRLFLFLFNKCATKIHIDLFDYILY